MRSWKVAEDRGWPPRFSVVPLLPTPEFVVRLLGEADDVTSAKAVDTIHGRVVKVDLDVDADYNGNINDLDEPLEETAGWLACVSNSLTPIKLTLEPTGLPGNVTLCAIMGGNRIRLWRNANGTAPVGLGEMWTQATMPPVLYVEGTNSSVGTRDVELTLTYDENKQGESNPLFQCSDKIRLTVVKVDLEINKALLGIVWHFLLMCTLIGRNFVVSFVASFVGASQRSLDGRHCWKGFPS